MGHQRFAYVKHFLKCVFSIVATMTIIAILVSASYHYLGAGITISVILLDVAIGCWAFYELRHPMVVDPDEDI